MITGVANQRDIIEAPALDLPFTSPSQATITQDMKSLPIEQSWAWQNLEVHADIKTILTSLQENKCASVT